MPESGYNILSKLTSKKYIPIATVLGLKCSAQELGKITVCQILLK